MTPGFHIADLFDITAEAVANRWALVSDQRSVTYAALAERTDKLAAALAAEGLQRGQHVGIFLTNCPEYVETFIALVKLGAVPFNVNYRYQSEELVYLFNNANAAAVVHGASLASIVDEIEGRVPSLRMRIEVADVFDTGNGASLDYEALIQSADRPQQPFPRSEDDYLLLYTGGTTGMPKGVMWPHRAFFFACLGGGGLFHPSGPVTQPQDIAERAQNGYQLRMLTVAPLMHGAAIWSALAALLGGLTLVLDTSKTFDADCIWSVIERHSVNIVQIVGDAMAIPLRDALKLHPGRWSLDSVVGFGSGGAVFSAHVKADIQELLPNVMITDGMGSSETGISGMAEPSPDGMMRLNANEYQQVIVEGRIGLVGETGLVGRAGHIPLGYYGDPEKTAEAFQEIAGQRWSITGDSGRLDADGKITVFGRGSTCINTGGEKVFPEEVEEVLRGHPHVFDAVVTAKPDERWGERVVAIVSSRRSHDPAPSYDDLKTFAAQHLAGYKVPREIIWVESIPRSPAGKQNYQWARSYALAH